MASDETPFAKAIAEYKPPPVTKDTAINYYAPAFGTLNYAFLSINVMNPGILQRVLPKPDLTNMFLFNSCIGSFLFISGRPHLSEAPLKLRVAYSVYGSILFNMGSVLSWAILRSLLPNNSGLATVTGLVSGLALTGCGVAYLNYNDKAIKANKK